MEQDITGTSHQGGIFHAYCPYCGKCVMVNQCEFRPYNGLEVSMALAIKMDEHFNSCDADRGNTSDNVRLPLIV